MHRVDHPLLGASLGSQRVLTSFHFGAQGAPSAPSGPKVYIQASLHAEELPGMLVAHHLHTLLAAADAEGQIVGEVVLVPAANPIGLAQRLNHKPMGRFELDSSENFNRHYPDFAQVLLPTVRPLLGDDAMANVATVRRAMAGYLAQWTPSTELQSLRHTLLTLAHDSSVVLDLHCDSESVLHFFTEEACWPAAEPLTRYLQCQAILLAKQSGSNPFDECLSGVWWQLSQALAGTGLPLPQGCLSATVELRGEADVSHALARTDAQAIYAYLQHMGAISATPLPMPAALCQATPLAGSETLCAPAAGVVVFAAAVGQLMQVGDLVAEVINPISQETHRVLAGVAGPLYARIRDRYVHAGNELGKIAGATPFRSGELLGA
jgi:predicted deacylase